MHSFDKVHKLNTQYVPIPNGSQVCFSSESTSDEIRVCGGGGGALHRTVSGEFNFGLYLPSISHVLYEA
jgi:hypothetical protein